MAYCAKCGIEKQDFGQCPNCGYQEVNQVNPNDKGGFLYFLLGACIPILGIILYFVWKTDKPRNAKMLLIGSLIFIPIFFFIGFIAGFVIPAIGNSMSEMDKSMIYNDAIQVENASELYCSDLTCDVGTELTYSDISEFISSFDDDYYDLDNNGGVISVKTSEGWAVYLEAAGTGEAEFAAGLIPSASNRNDVIEDTD